MYATSSVPHISVLNAVFQVLLYAILWQRTTFLKQYTPPGARRIKWHGTLFGVRAEGWPTVASDLLCG
jgi:hypothetical protein